MSDELQRAVGEANGKLDLLISSFSQYQAAHDRRHEQIDGALKEHGADINKAKGAKVALLTAAAAVSGFVGIAIAAAERILK